MMLARAPRPSDRSTALRMQTQRQRDTQCELAIRRQLYRLGIRYRIDCRPVPDVHRRADIVIRPAKIALFMDGCFWHKCPLHWKPPKRHAAWWINKVESTARRDKETSDLLERLGWLVIRAWEHECPEVVADKVVQAVCQRHPRAAVLFAILRSGEGTV